MISQLKLKNYRCISNAELDLKPITLFTGANSSGKTTILNSIVGSLQGDKYSSFPFSYTPNGEHCSLGGYKTIVSNNDITKNIELSFTFNSENKNGSIFSCASQFEHSRTGSGFRPIKVTIDHENYCLKINKDHEKYYADVVIKKRDKVIEDFTTEFIRYSLSSCLDKDQKKCDALITKYKNQINEDNISFSAPTFSKLLAKIYNHASGSKSIASTITEIDEIKESLYYVGPSRKYPSRVYLKSASVKSKIHPAGDNAVDIISRWKENKSKKLTTLNKIGRSIGIFQNISTGKLEEGLLKIIINTIEGKKVGLQDTGYGVSQVLPILAAEADAPKNSIFIIAQPELHLHPTAQGNIATLFTESAKNNNNQYIIETHSEYIISRFRALVANKKIDSSNIIIYHMTPSDNGISPHKITISDEGKLLDAPKDYFETYRKDIMNILLAGE